MSQHGSFRFAGGPSCILDKRDIVLRINRRPNRVRTASRKQRNKRIHTRPLPFPHPYPLPLFPLDEGIKYFFSQRQVILNSRHNNMLKRRFVFYLLHPRVQQIEADDYPGTGIGHLVQQFPFRIQRIGLHNSRSREQCTVVSNDALRDIRQHNRNAVTLVYSKLSQCIGKTVAFRKQLLICYLLAHKKQSRRMRICCRCLNQQFIKCDVRVGKLMGNFCRITGQPGTGCCRHTGHSFFFRYLT